MSIPAGITSITVTGKYLAPDGTPLSGYVVFTPSIKAADSTDKALVPAFPYKVTLDGTGAFSVALMATDDTTWVTPGWTYEVSEVITAGGTTNRSSYNIEVPTASGGGTLDLAAAVVVDLPGTPSQYLLKAGGTVTGALTVAATLRHTAGSLGFFNASAITKPTVTGSRGSNAALASLITALANLGLITDSSS